MNSTRSIYSVGLALGLASILGAATGCWAVSTLSDDVEGAELVDQQKVKVVGVIKGDEVEVEADKKRAKLRLLGVLAFDDEIQDAAIAPLRQASIAHLSQGARNKAFVIRLGPKAKDSHGRYLAYLEADEVDLNRSLVEAGLSMVYNEYPFARETEYLKAESEARAKGLGLWKVPSAVKLAKGLRSQWAKFRLERTGKAPADPLLAKEIAH